MTTISGEGCTLGDNCKCASVSASIVVKRACDNWSIWSRGTGETEDFTPPPRGRGPTRDGLTTLDHFAMAALTGILAQRQEDTFENIAEDAYAAARAMMKERAK